MPKCPQCESKISLRESLKITRRSPWVCAACGTRSNYHPLIGGIVGGLGGLLGSFGMRYILLNPHLHWAVAGTLLFIVALVVPLLSLILIPLRKVKES